MSWYTKSGNASDVILSSRCRLARNITKVPMGSQLTEEKAKGIISDTSAILGDTYTAVDFTKLDYVTASAYVEEHIVSSEFAKSKAPHTLFKNDSDGIYIMTPEEDHFRIQSIIRGDALDTAYENASSAEKLIAENFPLAFDENLGYLTHCPTNLGTAMRVSYMMFLPALTKFGSLEALSESLHRLGFTIRGMYGEGSGGVGYIYQISNSVTLGVTERETVDALKKVAETVVSEERRLRRKLYENDPDGVTDKISRAYGTLGSAYLLSRREFTELWVNARLGVSLGESTESITDILPKVSYEALDSLLIEAQSSVLTLSNGGAEMTPHERDIKRAQLVRERLKT